jgi:hypothetical protein
LLSIELIVVSDSFENSGGLPKYTPLRALKLPTAFVVGVYEVFA